MSLIVQRLVSNRHVLLASFHMKFVAANLPVSCPPPNILKHNFQQKGKNFQQNGSNFCCCKIRQRACRHRAAMLGPTRNDRNLLKVKMYCSRQLQTTCFNFIFFDILKWPRFGFQNSTNFIRAPLRIFHPTKVNFCSSYFLLVSTLVVGPTSNNSIFLSNPQKANTWIFFLPVPPIICCKIYKKLY